MTHERDIITPEKQLESQVPFEGCIFDEYCNIYTNKALEFEKLFSELKPRYVAFAYRYVRNMQVAEDLVSDSFMAFWEMQQSLRPDINVRAYILTIVKNKCLNHLHAQICHRNAESDLQNSRMRLIETDIKSCAACDPYQLYSDDIREITDKTIRMMNPITRDVFRLSRLEGKTYKEIADTLNISISHVNFEIRKALDLLRTELQDYINYD